MKTTTFLLGVLMLLASVAPGWANINFTLASKRELEGAPDPQHRYITDGDSHIYLRIPMNWTGTGSPAKLELIPEEPSSSVTISQVGGAQALPLDAGGLATLRQKAQDSIPEGAKDLKSVGEVNDLLPVFGWKSFEITFEYEFYGQRLRRSTLYVNMIPGRVIQVVVSALPPDFDKVHEKMRKLMFGWFEPTRDLSPEQAHEYENGGYKGG